MSSTKPRPDQRQIRSQSLPEDQNDAILKYRKEFSSSIPGVDAQAQGRIHFNNAGIAPLAKTAMATMELWMQKFYEEGTQCIVQCIETIEKSRMDLATLLGATEKQLAFFTSTSQAISQVATGLDFQAGDEIITWDQEYPANFYPWRMAAEKTGAHLKLAKSGENLATPASEILKLITPKTKAIAFSWVQFKNGAITDIRAVTDVARAKGIFTCADIIQGAGLLPFDFNNSGLDAACGGGHKWLTSTAGAGYLLLREEHTEKLMPLATGASTFNSPDILLDLHGRPKSDIHRFEPGSGAFLQVFALGAMARLIQQTGIDRIAQEAEWLSRKLMHGLREHGYLIHSPHGAHHRGSIVNFSAGPDSPLKNTEEIEARFQSRKVSFAKRPPGGVRLSPHAFNTQEEIQEVLKVLA
jgi:cysteine desulfurase / selenocysteine lyase